MASSGQALRGGQGGTEVVNGRISRNLTPVQHCVPAVWGWHSKKFCKDKTHAVAADNSHSSCEDVPTAVGQRLAGWAGTSMAPVMHHPQQTYCASGSYNVHAIVQTMAL
jgi:hypothetical protein